MDEKLQFVAALLAGERSMAELCRQFGISRKTGYALRMRYAAAGPAGLLPRSHARRTQVHQTPADSEAALMALKARYPTWGPKKLVARLRTDQQAGTVAAELVIPAPSTAGLILARHGLVRHRRRSARSSGPTQPLLGPVQPNDTWCADFKGSFRTGDGALCTPLTISDAASRYLLRAQALGRTATDVVQPLFEVTFREYGLPTAIRTDNGPPFASMGLGGLTPLSVWWLKLEIRLERITPGKPQQNGRHERMHRTLAEDTARPPAATLRAQQRALDAWRDTFNHTRPHEALGMAPPAAVYAPARRPYPGRAPDFTYPDAEAVRRVRPNGAIAFRGREWHVTLALIGEPVGLTACGDGQWELAAGSLPLATLDERSGRVHPLCPRPAPRGAPAVADLSPI